MTTEAAEAAARALHHLTVLHYSISAPGSPVTGWDDLSDQAKHSYRSLAEKASEAPTFEEFYAFTTLTERLMGRDYPDAADDTERTRGARAQYYLVQHLTRVEFPLFSGEEG